MKNLKNYLLGAAIAFALAAIVWAFPAITETFKKPVTFLLMLIVISPLVAAYPKLRPKPSLMRFPRAQGIRRTASPSLSRNLWHLSLVESQRRINLVVLGLAAFP